MLDLELSNEDFRLVAFDPGSTNLGCAFLKKNLDKDKIMVDTVFTAVLKDNHPSYKLLSEIHPGKVVRLLVMKDIVADFLNLHKPHAVIVESNYMGRFASGFAALVECVAIIRAVLYDYDKFLPLYLVDPSTVKKDVGMTKIKGTTKDDVKNALLKLEDVDWCDVDSEALDEHSIDAVAVGYHYFKKLI